MFRYQRQILSHLTTKRVANLLGLGLSYIWMKKFQNSKATFLPFSATIEPTTACNLSCPECPSGLKMFSRPTGKMDVELHQKWLKQLSGTVFYVNYYFQGEPFLHPNFLTLIQEATRQNVFSSTSSNGHFITDQVAEKIIDSGLGQLILSIDGLTQKTYEAYRINGQLEKVYSATKAIVEAKKRRKGRGPHVVWQFLVVRQNEHEIEELFLRAKEFGVDEVRLKTAQLYEFEKGNPLMPQNEKYSRYTKGVDGTYRIKNKLLNHCWRMWSSTVLTWDGQVVPCCFDKDAKHVLGSLEQSNFKHIWRHEKYQVFRKAVFTHRESIDICKNCTEGTTVFSH